MARMYRRISDTAALAELMRFLFDRNRSLPVIVITARRAGNGPVSPPAMIQEACGSHAQVYLMSPAFLAEFNDLNHNVFGITPSGLRIYRAHMSLQDHHLRHPIWNEVRVDQMVREERLIDEIKDQVVEIKRYDKGRDCLREKPAAVVIVSPPRPKRPILRISLNG